ncbi:MAG: polymer-forming cytoskeletal protein [Clostridiales bacterium]|nr:polymer-forming cytoskeletal protein [Clostridiales bacterium]
MKKNKAKRSSNLIKIGTFLDASTKITGDIATTSNLKVDGAVDGNLLSSCDIVIGETAVIRGNVHAGDVVVSGSVQGDISARSTLTLTEKGKIEGNIRATGFIVDIGSQFQGSCTIIDENPQNAAQTTTYTLPVSEHTSENPMEGIPIMQENHPIQDQNELIHELESRMQGNMLAGINNNSQ